MENFNLSLPLSVYLPVTILCQKHTASFLGDDKKCNLGVKRIGSLVPHMHFSLVLKT